MPTDGQTLASPTELARELKEPRRTIYNWIAREDFPEPAVTTAGGSRLWDLEEVRRWRDDTADTRKSPGRPRS